MINSEFVQLSDVFDVRNGYAFTSKEQQIQQKEDYIEILKQGHIQIGGGLRRAPKKFYVPTSQKLQKYILEKGDIVMAMTDMKDNVVILGVPAMIDQNNKYVLNQRVGWLKPKKNLLTKFFYYQMLTREFIEDLRSKANSGVQVNLSTDGIKEMLLWNPSIEIQQNIAEVLSSLDEKIDLLHRNNKTQEQLSETLFRQWFVEEAEDNWEKTELRNLINLYRGLSYKGSGLTDKSDNLAIPMINLNSVLEGGGFKITGTKYYNGEFRENHHVYPGDVVITNTEQGHECRLIGYSTIIPNYIGQKAIFSQHIYRITPKDKKVSSQYLNCLFKNSVLRDQIIGATNGSTVNMLPAEGVLRCTVKVPTINKMETFSKLAEDIQTKIESNYLQIQQLETLRDTLLPKLMSGVVRVGN